MALQADREALERGGDVLAPAHLRRREREREERGGEVDEPAEGRQQPGHGAGGPQPEVRPEREHVDDRDHEPRGEGEPREMARGAQPTRRHARHGEREQHRGHLAQRDHRVADEPRVGPDHVERVRRAVARARRDRRRLRKGVHEQGGRQVQQHEDQGHRGRERAVAAAQQDAGREDEQQDQRQVLGDPRGDAPRAVEHRRVRLRERHHHHQEAGHHEQRREALRGPAAPLVQADRDRDQDGRGAAGRDEPVVVGVAAERHDERDGRPGEPRDGDRHGRAGRQPRQRRAVLDRAH